MTAQDGNLPVVFVFLDTEFTSLQRPELISIGLSASDGTEFYCERTDYPTRRCSAFVRSEVVPKLGWDWHAQARLDELAARTQHWFADKARLRVPVLAFDYEDDGRLVNGLLTPELRAAVVDLQVRVDMSEQLLQEYFARPDVVRHHALHDARALAWSCAPWMGRTPESLAPVSAQLSGLEPARRLMFLRTHGGLWGGSSGSSCDRRSTCRSTGVRSDIRSCEQSLLAMTCSSAQRHEDQGGANNVTAAHRALLVRQLGARGRG